MFLYFIPQDHPSEQKALAGDPKEAKQLRGEGVGTQRFRELTRRQTLREQGREEGIFAMFSGRKKRDG
jgi:hypothetical protein